MRFVTGLVDNLLVGLLLHVLETDPVLHQLLHPPRNSGEGKRKNEKDAEKREGKREKDAVKLEEHGG
jgi:hypothetical protein